MKKIIILVFAITMCLLCSCSSGLEDTYFKGAVEADSSLSKMTESDAVKIAMNYSDKITSKYDTYDATYYSDGTWHVLCYNKPIKCGDGIVFVIDDTKKDIIDIIEQE